MLTGEWFMLLYYDMKKVALKDGAGIGGTTTANAVTAISLTAARLSLAAAAAFVVLLAALHVIKPELDPSWRFISEYEIGDHGWIMALAFLSLALSCVALFIAIRSQMRTIVGRIGLALLLLSAAGMIVAAIFTTDPIAGESARTTHGKLHELGAMLDVIPFAALIINLSLARNPAWFSARRSLLWTVGLPLIGNVVFIAALVAMLPIDGKFGPDVLIGWPNRLMILSHCGWLMTVAWRAIQLNRKKGNFQ